MTYYPKEYTLHNGKKIYAEYDDHNICQITKECLEMLLGLYQQGRADAIDEFVTIIKERVGMDWEWDFYFIGQIAEELKEQKCYKEC